MKRSVLTPIVVALVAIGSGGWFLQRSSDQEKNVYANAQLFDDVMKLVQTKFVDAKDPSELYTKAINGMMDRLGDPHSVFMTPKDYDNLRTSTEGQYGGIGIQISRRGDYVTVLSPLPGTPAERIGLRAGDAIIEVDGVSAKGWSDEMAMSKLKGQVGKAVNIKIARPGINEPMPFTIVREEIHLKAVPSAFMIGNGVGYVELTIFSETSTDELRNAVRKLKSQGAKGIVLDLRRNPGGLLDQGATVSDLFLKKGDLIVETKGRDAAQNERLVAAGTNEFDGMQIVTLVGPNTASAAEILAGALQDHDRSLVLGRTSYGKGSVQSVYPLANNNFLKLTTARWYTPSGRSIQKPYGIGLTQQDAGADDAPLSKDDSTKNKPQFKTDAGRTVYGGGGIVPDLVVPLDTTTSAERAFLSAIGKMGQQYASARLAFAVDYLRANPSLLQNFTVTPQMMDGFYAAMQQKGIKVDRAVFNAASRWIASDVAYEIAYSKWGEQGARQRVNGEDSQVRVATQLIQQSTSQTNLFKLASDYAASHKQTAPDDESQN